MDAATPFRRWLLAAGLLTLAVGCSSASKSASAGDPRDPLTARREREGEAKVVADARANDPWSRNPADLNRDAKDIADQRNQNADHISIGTGGDGDQSMLVAILTDLLGLVGRGSLRILRLYEFNRLHSAQSPHIADNRPTTLPLASTSLEMIAEFVSLA